eukprot:355871-Chlamydomonas_euryale.AAC.3
MERFEARGAPRGRGTNASAPGSANVSSTCLAVMDAALYLHIPARRGETERTQERACMRQGLGRQNPKMWEGKYDTDTEYGYGRWREIQPRGDKEAWHI